MIRIQWRQWLLLFISVRSSESVRSETPWHDNINYLSQTLPSSNDQHYQSHHRQLNWQAFNDLIYNAVLNFPDSELEGSGLTLKVTSLTCTGIRVQDVQLQAAMPSTQQVITSTTITGLDLTCRARYEFAGYLIVNGSGDLYVELTQNSAIVETLFTSLDYNQLPPIDSAIQSCQPTININKMEFSNGGFWGFTLEQLQGMFRGLFEGMVESRLCEELQAMSEVNLDRMLIDMQNRLNGYPENIVIDPLASEVALLQSQVDLQAASLPTSPLINWQAPDTYPFGFFLDEAWNDMVTYLNEQVTLSDGQMGLNANLLLQKNVLTEGVLTVDIDPADQIIYQGHDKWTQTTMRADQIRIRGLDSITALDPMVTIGQYTLQSNVSWEVLYLEMDMSLDIVPSTLPDSYILEGGQPILERVTVQFAMSQVDARISVLLALDQSDIEALQVGHFLQKDNILPCFLSSIYSTEVSALTVDAIDLQPPQITGFVSEGLDNVISSAIQAGFLMYESSMLKSSKAFFQKTIRELVNERIRAEQESFGATGCTLLTLPPPLGIVDARELLLEPAISASLGGAGLERYGDLFYGFVMPTLQKEVLTDDNINERFLRPFTLKQSGQQGTINASTNGQPWLDYLQNDSNGTTWVSMLGWESFKLQAWGGKIHNIDTITSPIDVMIPIDGMVLANVVQTGLDTPDRPLKFSISLTVTGQGRDAGVPNMSNEVEISLGIPRTTIEADVLVAMNETSLLHFPLKDLDNKYCWLAALTAGAEHPAVNLEKMITTLSSFTFDVACVSCSSPGASFLPTILQTMKDGGLLSSFEPYLEAILSEVVKGAWVNMNFPALIQDAPRLCPHYAGYDPIAVASDSYGLPNSFAAPPLWSSQSLETIAAIFFLSAYGSLFVVATNHLLQPDLELQPGSPVAIPLVNPNSNESAPADNHTPFDLRLLDWSDLSSTLGPWADDLFDEARQTLRKSFSKEYSSNTNRRLSISDKNTEERRSRLLQADSFIRDHLLDTEGRLNIPFDDVRFDFAGMSFSLVHARIFGVDTITHLDPFVVVGPQTLENKLELQDMKLSLDLEVTTGGEIVNFTLQTSFLEVAVELPLVLAMDLDKMGGIELGSIMQRNRIIPCLLEGAHQVYIPWINVTIGTMERPTLSSSMSPNLLSTVVLIADSLFDDYGNDLGAALPGLFDTTIRRTLNTWLDQYVRQVDATLCEVKTGGGVVDFRDLFLAQDAAKSLGGSGMQQYGNLFLSLHDVMKKELSTKDGKPPSVNSLLSSWTAKQSNVSGTLQIPGNVLDTGASIVLGGLNATLGIKLGDIYLENLDTLGSPISFLDPLDANTLNNTASFGIGAEPLRLTARLVLSLTDNKEMQVHNDVNISVDMYEATATATVLLKVAEDALLKFPLKDVTNFYCWISTTRASTDDTHGIALAGYALRLQELKLNVSCLSCTSARFGDLIADLYAPTDGEAATNTVYQTLSQISNGAAIQDFLDQFVEESSSKCPHSSTYDPSALMTASEHLINQAVPFSFTDFTTRSSRSSYFNIASAVFAGCLLLFFVLGKLFVWRQNKKWKESLSNEGMSLLSRQKEKEKEQDDIINMNSTSMFRSPHIPRHVRWLVPAVFIINIVLYLGGHLGVLATVDIDVYLAGEEFTIHNFIVFSFLDATSDTYRNGGMEMSIMLWIFAGVWPYVKLLSSLFLWFAPPRCLSVSTRRKLLLWIDTLTKLSIMDIFTMILFLAVLLIYIGGPDEKLYSNGELYSMRVIMIPGASIYCLGIAQRISRASSRFFLDYHDQVVDASREASAKGEIKDETESRGKNSEAETCPSPGSHSFAKTEFSVDGSDSRQCFRSSTRQGSEEEKEDFDRVRCERSNVLTNLDRQDKDHYTIIDSGDHKLVSEEHDRNVQLVRSEDTTSVLSKEKRPPSCLLCLSCFSGRHLGVAFGGLSVLAFAIIGCIYAPSVSIDISDLWGLALESDITFEEAAMEYGVFSVVSAVLLKARFVLDSTWDFVALGCLLAAAFVCVGMVFFVDCYRFIRRLKEEGWSAIRPKGSTTLEIPSYLSLHAYQHIEIYVVAVVVGCWQLGSVSIYAIHLYCSILDAVYRVLTYIGLAQTSTAQCFEAQMTLPDNLLIFFGCLLILLANFYIQSSKQYRKNIKEACDLLRHEDHDVEHLSSLWNTSTKRSFWSGSTHRMMNRTATFSEDCSDKGVSPSSYVTGPSSTLPPFIDQQPSGESPSSYVTALSMSSLPSIDQQLSGESASSYGKAPSLSPLPFIEHQSSTGGSLSVSTLSKSPSRTDPVHGARITTGSFSGSPVRGDHKVIASVDQYSTPQ